MTNIQVTHETSLDNARSESSLAINPINTQQIIAGSKRFINYHNYDFMLATSYSTDGGVVALRTATRLPSSAKRCGCSSILKTMRSST